MSKSTKRKHVHMEVLQGDLELPADNQKIVRVLGSRGNNLHQVQSPESSTFLVSMPNKFRKNIWIKKGDYVLVEPIDEGEKVKAEIVKVLRPDYIKYLKKESVWPVEFAGDEKKCSDDGELFVNNNQNVISASATSSSSSSDESE